MLHGDAGAFLSLTKSRENVYLCVEAILDYFGTKGTVIVPTFTYSATKSQRYNVKLTPSSIGNFSEMFRVNSRMKRTRHPNFSVSVAGHKTDEVLETRVDDAFGPGTIFDFLYNENAKLVTIGCSINRLTFTHYVEQKEQVFYRFMKSFMANVEEAGYCESFRTTYYVRDLGFDLDTSIDLTKFQHRATCSGYLRVTKFGRFESTAISARHCFAIMSEMLKENQYALIRG